MKAKERYVPTQVPTRESTKGLTDKELDAAVGEAYHIHPKLVRRGKLLMSEIYGKQHRRMLSVVQVMLAIRDEIGDDERAWMEAALIDFHAARDDFADFRSKV